MGGYSQLPVTPFHQSDPLQQAGQFEALKNALNQQKLIPGQLQAQQNQNTAAQQENQMRALQIQDEQKMRQLSPQFVKKDDSGNVTGYDFDGFVKSAQASGISPKTINQLQLQRAETTEKLAGADAATRNNEAAKNKASYEALEGLRGIQDPQQRQAAYTQVVPSLQKMGVDTSKFPQQAPDDSTLATFETGLGVHAQIIADAKTKAETFKDTEQGNAAKANAAKVNAEISQNAPADPNIARQKYEGILQQIGTKGFGSLAPADFQWAKAYENAQKKTTTQADSLGVTSTNTSGPSGLAAAGKGAPAAPVATPQGVTPPAGAPARPALGAPAAPAVSPTSPASLKGNMVDMIGQYKLNPQMLQRLIVKHPEMLAQVNAKYPDWDQTTYNAKNKMVVGLAGGPDGKTLDAINTAMGHIKNLDDAIDALHNGDMTLLNKIGTKYNINVGGKTAEAAFQLIVHRVGPEIASAYIPGGGGQGERMADEKDFDVNLPPQTLHNNAAITVNMLRSKVGAIENRYKTIVGRDDFEKYLTPEAKASLQKMAPQGGGANNGGAKVPPAPAGMINVQLANGQSGTIKAENQSKFLKDNPGSKVLQ